MVEPKAESYRFSLEIGVAVEAEDEDCRAYKKPSKYPSWRFGGLLWRLEVGFGRSLVGAIVASCEELRAISSQSSAASYSARGACPHNV